MSKIDDSLSIINIDLKNLLEEHTKKLLLNISSDYKLNYEELLKKYLETNETIVNNNISKKKKKINELPDSSRCIANTAKLTRCTKSKLPGIEFCGFHKNKQQYGIIKERKNITVIEDIEYVIHENKIYLKEKLENIIGSLDSIDFSKITNVDCDGIVCEDGSWNIF